MMGRAGVLLGRDRIRVARVSALRPRTYVVRATDGREPGEVVAEIAAEIGRVAAVAVAVDLSLLFAKRLPLPPASPADRDRMVRLEPDRWWPLTDTPLVAAAGDGDHAFAAPERAVDEWITALDAGLGPVERVEAGPAAVARQLAATGLPDARLVWPLDGGGHALVAVRAGRLVRARRIYGGPAALRDAVADPELEALPLVAGAGAAGAVGEAASLPPDTPEPEWLMALGALTGLDRRSDAGSLAPASHRATALRRRWRRVAVGAGGLVLGLVFALSSLGAARSAAGDALEREIEALRGPAAAVQALQAELADHTAEAVALGEALAARAQPLEVLRLLSERLPRDVHLVGLTLADGEWTIEGVAADAAPLVPLLEADARVEGVRFTRGTRPALLEGERRERFTLAFRFDGSP